MRIAETVTFGGSGLDRAAELRGDAAAQARLWLDPAARCLAFWRGKPLVAGEARDRLGSIETGHPALAHAAEAPVFLGRGEAGPLFAADISAWEPEEGTPAELSAFLDPTEQTHPELPGETRFAELRSVMARLSPREAEIAAMARALFGWHQSHGFCARCGHRSEIEEAGWRRGCPSCKAQHFPRTDPVVIMLITLGNSVLLGRSRGWPEGMYSLLAGFIEPGETMEAAVRREVFEEAGVRVGAVRYLASQPWPFPASLMFGCAGEALSAEIEIDPVEIEDALWISREGLLEVAAGIHPRITAPRKGSIAQFLIANWQADRVE